MGNDHFSCLSNATSKIGIWAKETARGVFFSKETFILKQLHGRGSIAPVHLHDPQDGFLILLDNLASRNQAERCHTFRRIQMHELQNRRVRFVIHNLSDLGWKGSKVTKL